MRKLKFQRRNVVTMRNGFFEHFKPKHENQKKNCKFSVEKY